MSLLSSVSRAGPSTTLSRALRVQGVVGTRNYAAGVPGPVGKAGYLQNKQAPEKEKKLNKKRAVIKMYVPMKEQKDQDLPPLLVPGDPFCPPAFKARVTRDSSSIGKPFVINPSDNDPMVKFGLPQKLWLEFKLLSRPYTVIREVTRDMNIMLTAAEQKSSKENCVVLTGRPGCGKSFVLLQAVESCHQRKWVVIYIPRAVDLVNSTTSYVYDIRTQTYLQPSYSFQVLQRMLTVNSELLQNILLNEDLVLEKSVIPKGTPLFRVIESAIAERTRSMAQAPMYLDAVMKSLEVQTTHPVLLAIDDLQTIYGNSAYRDPQYQHIKSYHLSVPRLLLEYMSGKRSFNRGAVLGAISGSRTTHPIPLELRDALNLHDENYRIVSPYEKRNKVLLEYAQGIKNFEVPEKLTLAEAAGIFEIWKQQHVFGRDNFFYDEAFLGKYTESGGNARDFVWKGLLATLDA